MSGARRLWWAAGAGALLVVVLVIVLVTSGGSSSSSSSSSSRSLSSSAAASTPSGTATHPVAPVPSNSLSPYPVTPVSPSPLYTMRASATSTLSGRLAQRSLPGLSPPSGDQLGISVNGLFNGGDYSVAQINGQLRSLRSTGATVARSDALWEATEPTAPVDGVHEFHWSFDDTVASTLATHDLTWLPILDYSAPWAQSIVSQDHSPPKSDADYAAYAQAFAARYGLNGSFWHSHPKLRAHPVQTIEIWNEPDSVHFWYPRPDLTRYAGLYLAARRAIDAVDPSARVIIGGLIRAPSSLPAMTRAQPGLKGHIDGVAIHPYGTPAKLLSTIRHVRSRLRSLRMSRVPLYVTEFGWTTSPRTVPTYASARRRLGYITHTLAELGHLNCGLAASLLYAWVTPERDPTDVGDWYGIYKPSGRATPATAAFAKGLALARRPARTVALCRRTS